MTELREWINEPESWLGMAVDVILVDDNSQHIGTIVETGALTLDSGEVIDTDYPTIELADGRLIVGLDCWWTKREPGELDPLP